MFVVDIVFVSFLAIVFVPVIIKEDAAMHVLATFLKQLPSQESILDVPHAAKHVGVLHAKHPWSMVAKDMLNLA